MNNDPRGSMMQQGNLIFINNALIEEASCSNDFFSEILISYAVRENNNTSIQTIRLNLNQRTLVLDESGQSICLCCLRAGMWVNVIFSSQMTRSNPPQANAFLIAIQRSPQTSVPPQQPMPPQRPTPPPQRPTPPSRPVSPQQPNMRPGLNQPQQPISPQMRPTPQRPNQSQMSNQLENSDENGRQNQSSNSNQVQMPNWTSDSEQFQMPSWMRNATNSSQM